MRKGWKKSSLGDCIQSITSGVSVNSDDRPVTGEEIGILKTSCVYTGSFDPSQNKHVLEKEKSRVKCPVKKNTIVVSRMNTAELVGASGLVTQDAPNLFLPDRLWCVTPAHNSAPEWLAAVIGSTTCRTMLTNMATGTSGSMKNISQEAFCNIPVFLPPLAEQKKIAAILRTWDEAIEKVNQLVAQKERRLQYICASLINRAGYERKPIAHVAIETSSRNSNRAITRVLSVTNKNGFVLPEEQFQRRVASEDVSNYKIVRRGEYAYNPSRINVGSIARLDNHNEGILSPMYVTFALDVKKVNSNYFLYWLSSFEARQRIARSAQGSVRDSVGFNDLCSIKIPLPDIEKQNKIVDGLNVLKSEILCLQNKAEALKAQKRGLMQKLLTGEWPVRIEKEAA